MDDTVVNLLGLYAGLVLMNVIISAFMWWNSRAELHRDLVFLWASQGFAFFAQGVTGAIAPNDNLVIVGGFATLWIANVAYARLITRLVSMRIPMRASVAVFAIGLVAGVAAYLGDAHFTLVALPVALGVVFPALFCASYALWRHWNELSSTGRALMVSCIAITIHELDYPFLRHLPEYSAMGFTIAIVVVFALSVFAPAVVLEVVTKQQARTAAEMEVAHRIQRKVLPRDPQVPGLELTGYMRPAEEVGGDYYDVYTLGDHAWILLGDVTGHGLGSGLVMLMAQSILASILHTRREISPAELTWLANQILHQNLTRLDDLRSMTIVALRKTGDEHRFVYSGNHDHVYIYRAAERRVETVDVTQLPHDLGFLNEFPLSAYEECQFELGPGDILFLATDGVTEAARQGRYAEGMFESARVTALLEQLADRPLAEIKQRILDELERFTGGVYHDDVTFLLARPAPA